MPADPSSKPDTSSASNSADSNEETLTPAQLRDGVKLKAGPDAETIKVVGVSGRPIKSSK
jgi:hypothetical protein